MKNLLGRLTGRTPGKEKVQVKWEPIRDDVKETENIEAWPRGVVAFDVVFDEKKIPYIVEMHGIGAGVRGIGELEPSDVLAGIPAMDDTQLDFWIDVEQTKAERSRRLQELETLQKLARSWSLKGLEYTNPEWFAGEKGITRDKRLQSKFIPEENCPPTVDGKDFATLFLNHQKVILKPPDESQGKGVRVFKVNQIKDAEEYAAHLTKSYGGFVAQGFIKSRGADQAPEDLKGHAQSLRLVVPFKINDKGEIEVEIPKFGYQRVARYSEKEVEEGARLRGKRPGMRDSSVVNLSWDAAAVPMSDAEYELALPVVKASIRKLADHAKTQPEYQDKISKILFEKAAELRRSLDSTYDVQVENVHEEHTYSSDKGYARKVRKNFDEVKNYLFFLRFVEREFKALPRAFWESRTMRHARHHSRVERIPGTQKARIRLFSWKNGMEDFVFDLKNEKNEDAAGSLKNALETFVKKNRGLISRIRGT